MEENDNFLNNITENFETMVTGIPAPLRKNFWKAFSQLCSAVVEIPISYLEGKSDLIRETNNARKDIIRKSGQNIAEKINIPQTYSDKAVSKYASKIIREQINLDEITSKTIKELSVENSNQEEVKEISEEWLNEFENIAKLKSSEDMKIAFSKILAGEIKSPGKFSTRSLMILTQLNAEVSKYFQIIRNLASTVKHNNIILDSRVILFNNSFSCLEKYGLTLYHLSVLQEYGLIISELHTTKPYEICIGNEFNTVQLPFTFQNIDYGLLPIDRSQYNGSFSVTGIKLTKAGEELLEIIPLIESNLYKNDLIEFYRSQNLRMAFIE